MKKIIKKLSVFVFVLCCLLPLTGCPPRSTLNYTMKYSFNEDRTFVDDTIYFCFGIDRIIVLFGEGKKNDFIDEQKKLREYRDFEVGMKIDDNEEYVIKYTIKDDELFSSKYKYNYRGSPRYTEDGIFEFNFSKLNVKKCVRIIFSYCHNYYKSVDESKYSGYCNESGKLKVVQREDIDITVDLQTNEEYSSHRYTYVYPE